MIVFITDNERVYWAVRPKSLTTTKSPTTPREPGFVDGAVRVRSVVDGVLVEQGSLRVLRFSSVYRDRGSTVVKVLRYKSEGRWFDPRWLHWNFSLT
jgi:hypothetical protein